MDHVCSLFSFQCTSCLNKYKTNDKLRKHKEKHDIYKPLSNPSHVCGFCKMPVRHLIRHEWEAHRIGKPRFFPCTNCGKEFTHKFDLAKHMPRCRSSFKFPVQCDACPLRYKIKKTNKEPQEKWKL